jgi:hypothetical protein
MPTPMPGGMVPPPQQQLQYAPQPQYTPQPGYAPQPQPGYPNVEPQYAQQPRYAPQQPGYPPYPPEPQYAQQPQYPPQPQQFAPVGRCKLTPICPEVDPSLIPC